MNSSTALSNRVRKGLAWSSVNAVVMRIGTFAVGIFLARILAPEEFGVFAIALTVQAVLMTLADFGLSTDLIRSKDHEAKAPTVATMGLVMGTLLFLLMWSTSGSAANLLGTPEAGPVIAWMSASLLMAGLSVVPYAKLQREFQQKRLFGIALIDFIVVNTVTIVLVLMGWGVIALAIARIVAQSISLVAYFVLAGVRPKFGFDRKLAPAILAFGLPLAGANLMSWVLLSSDNVVISSLAGPVSLGFYYLAFNMSNWPMSVIGQVVRSVALPAFSHDEANRTSIFSFAVGLIWPVTLLAGTMLSLLAGPVINVVYGEKWNAAVPLLVALGLFGAIRTVFDLAVSFLLAKGRSTQTMIVQAVWLAVLLTLMIWWTNNWGPIGTALAHLVCAVVVVAPMYMYFLLKSGVEMRGLMASIWPPIVAMAPASVATLAILALDLPDIAQLLAGGALGTFIYVACIYKWYLRRLRQWRVASATSAADVPATDAVVEVTEAVLHPRKATSDRSSHPEPVLEELARRTQK